MESQDQMTDSGVLARGAPVTLTVLRAGRQLKLTGKMP